MDETEVQVEIACWAQEHPEAQRINWQGGNEPWVSFPGKLCTLHMGLGGLIWSIGVPIGYQTQLHLVDGSRKRCWDPFDFHDTVIVQDRNTPFRVSVLYPKNDNNVLEEKRLLVQQPGYDFQDAQEHVLNLLEHLRISDGNADGTSNQELRLMATTQEYFQAMNKAETLSEVLDIILALTTFHAPCIAASMSTCADVDELQRSYSMDTNESNGESCGDDLFGPEPAYKWSWIKAQVEYAAEACRIARNHVESGVTSPNVSQESVVHIGGRVASSLVTLVEEMDGVEIADIITVSSGSAMLLGFDSKSNHMKGEYAYVRTMNSNDRRKNNGTRIMSCSSSDSELSDGTDDSWEDVLGMSQVLSTDFMCDSGNQGLLPSSNKLQFQQVYAPEGAEAAGARAALIAGPPASTSTTCYEQAPDAGFGGCPLQYCDISFNSASFSVECTIMLEKFMQNNTSALTAMGLSIEYPLRVEVVPNKEQVDALAWTGLVEVFVSQQSEWHSHVSEEVCGLLCFVPHVVRQYFETNVFANLRHRSTRDPKGELFTGLLETVVKRLVNLSRDNCCICSEPLEEFSRTFMSRIMWPCSENMCQALYASWQVVSSYDADERVRQEQESLADVEKDIREDFPYSECILDNLKCALDVYNVDCEGLHYGQMIRALARIELWNRRDLEKIS